MIQSISNEELVDQLIFEVRKTLYSGMFRRYRKRMLDLRTEILKRMNNPAPVPKEGR